MGLNAPSEGTATGSAEPQAHRSAAVVIGLDCFTGLQTARILAGHGIRVIGIASNPEHFCCRTRSCSRVISADITTEALIDSLEALASELDAPAVLYPCTDISVSVLSRHRGRIEPLYHLMLPDPDVVETLIDKVGFIEFAQQNGLPIPDTYFLKDREEAEDAARRLSYPCILKPPRKTARWQANCSEKVFKIQDREEFLALYDRSAPFSDVLMAQEWVEGSDADLYSCNCYFDAASQPVATFVARKLRQWPPEAGTSCLGEEVRNDEVLETTLRLFRGVGYRGLGYVEVKRDTRTGRHYIIEPNIGRPTGRSAIAEAGGVELLYSQYCDVTGLTLPDDLEQKYGGVKWIYLRRDLQSAVFYWRRGDLTIRQWWQSLRGKKAYALFSWRDPMPFLGDLRHALGVAASRWIPRSRHRPDEGSRTAPENPGVAEGVTR